MMLSNPAAI
jgi:hypothetical protein